MERNEPVTQTTECDSDESEVNRLIGSLSQESQSLVKVLTLIISIQLSQKLSNINKELEKKDKQIQNLTSVVNDLQDKISDLESNLDNVDQYERRDTIIPSGPSVPTETDTEHTASVVVNTIKDNLK